jgi:hypothetical protein
MMSKRYCLVIFCSLVFHSFGAIRVVCTTALTDKYFEFREKQYKESFSILKSYGVKDFYIVEALKKQGPTFLEEYASNVFYSTVNNASFTNNGANEAATFLEGLYYFDFDDEDLIIKFTGRHQLTSDYILRLIEKKHDYDAFVNMQDNGGVSTLGFAMKCKHFKKMYEDMQLNQIGFSSRSIEYFVGDFILKKSREDGFKVCYLEKLYMKANTFGSSTALGASGIVYY